MAEVDDDLQALRALPPLDVDDEGGARVRRVAMRTFREEHVAGRSELGSRAAVTWSRFVVPALLGSATIVYLAWAVTFATGH